MAATTTLLGLVTPTQGTLSGTWGDTVNYGISDYVDIAIAGTLSFANDGAITLANTTGSSSGNSITTTTAQYMVIRITGTQTVTKIITGPSYSKLYMVDHAGATSAVTFKAAGQSGVSVAVGEKCFVYYNGTDYVKVASSVVATGTVTSVAVSGGTTGLTTSGGPITTSGTVTLAGTVATTNGGTGLTSFTSGGVVYASSGSALATGSALVFDGTNLGIGTSAPTNKLHIQTEGTSTTSTIFLGAKNSTNDSVRLLITQDSIGTATLNSDAGGNGTPGFIFKNSGTEGMRLTSAGLLVGGTAARGTTAGTAHLDLFNGTAPAGTLTNGVSLYSDSGDLKFMNAAGDAYNVGYRNVPQSGSAKTTSYTLAVTDVGEFIQLGASGAIVIPDATFAAGDVVSIFNNTASTATITCSITTAYIAGTFTDKATMTLAAAGVATVLFITSTLCVVSGNVT